MVLLILFNFLPVLSIILKSKSPFELMNKPNMKDAIEALIPYSGKINFVHNKRDTELIVSSSMTVCCKHVEKYYLSTIIYKCHLSLARN